MRKTSTRLISAAATVVMKCVSFAGFCLLLILSFSPAYGQSVLLVDADGSEDRTYNEYSELTGGDDRLYFIGNETELWTSSIEDPEDLIMLKEFSSISDLTRVGGTLYFVADDGSSGLELWRSNGTAESTRVVKDIHRGAEGSSPALLTNLRGVLYFVASDGIHGRELWKSNGSPRGTVLVKDIMPRGGNSHPSDLTAVGETLFFAAKDATHGTELWKTNGTEQGTAMVKDIRPGTGVNSTPSDLVDVYGTLFFVAADAAAGRELWKSDGTAEGTTLVKDIAPGPDHSRIDNLTAMYRTVFFTATDGLHGQELWKSDGTEAGTVMVKDMTPGPEGSQGEELFAFEMGNFTNIYGTLFFTAYQNDTYYIWKSNGTANGTVPVALCGGPGIWQPKPMFTFFKDRVYYFNTQSEYDAHQLWSMDRNGSNHESIVEFNLEDVYNPYYPEIAVVDDRLYLAGQPDFFFGFKMLISDGTRAGTRWIEDIRTTTQGSDPKEFTELNGKLYFLANDTYYDHDHLYVTDGTPEGTQSVIQFDTDVPVMERLGNTLFAAISYPFGLYKADLHSREAIPVVYDENKDPVTILTQAAGKLFFSNGSGEIWTSDGTEAGTVLLHDFHQITAITPVSDKILFRALAEDGTDELWRSDGTVAGTMMIKTLHAGHARPAAYNPVAVTAGTLYFVANDGIHGNEVWKSDGTAAGTSMVVDLNTNDPSWGAYEFDIRSLSVFENAVYISAIGHDGQSALFKTNGTASGTFKVANIPPVVYSVATEDQLLLFTDASDAGAARADLWTTDGSAEGTQMVRELNQSYGDFSHQLLDDVVYFSMMEGGDLWRTDGTACGTFMPEIGSRGASPIAALGDVLIFGSYDEQAGFEPHALNTAELPGNPCVRLASGGSQNTSEEKIFPGYPNPFINDFTLRIEGSGDNNTRVQVFTLYGKPVEDIGELEANTEHRIGQSWAKGIYVLQVIRDEKVERYILVKE